MIWQIVKKQLLLLWRNPQQLLLLIGLPIILIAILGTALGSIMDGQSPEIQVNLIMIHLYLSLLKEAFKKIFLLIFRPKQ